MKECHKIALAYLHQKVKRGALNPEFFGLSLEDLALDCIADLFETDGDGGHPALDKYFEPVVREEADIPSLQIALRRLVFSKVNEGLFRRYREQDPGLARIIRNLKIGVSADARFTLTRRGSETWVRKAGSDGARRNIPLIPPEILEAYLIPELITEHNLKSALRTLHDIFEYLTAYRDEYPLSMLARCIRSAHGRLAVEDEPLHTNETAQRSEALLHDFEMESLLDDTLNEVSRESFDTYVGKGKVSEDMFSIYFSIIREVLLAQYSMNGEAKTSYFDALQNHRPGTSRSDYLETHRNVIEYLGKLSKRRLLERIKGIIKD